MDHSSARSYIGFIILGVWALAAVLAIISIWNFHQRVGELLLGLGSIGVVAMVVHGLLIGVRAQLDLLDQARDQSAALMRLRDTLAPAKAPSAEFRVPLRADVPLHAALDAAEQRIRGAFSDKPVPAESAPSA